MTTSQAVGTVGAVGASVQIKCPVEGCDYSDWFRLGMGEESGPAGTGERAAILRDEHPDHPEADQPGSDQPAKP